MVYIDLAELAVTELTNKSWQRFRDIRVASLTADPDAFGGDLTQILQQSQADWEEKFEAQTPIVATYRDQDIALMVIENIQGDFGATCWIGGCWVQPDFRGHGVMRTMFDYVDQQAENKSWQVQGLGVWVNNFAAIAVYEAIGFSNAGEPKPSTSKPGMFYQRMIKNVENLKAMESSSR